jgi:hypothetical protein
MGDRDLLPDNFKAGHYDLKLTNLDFKDWSYNGSVTYAILPLTWPARRAHELSLVQQLILSQQHRWKYHQTHKGDRHQCSRAEPQECQGLRRVWQGQQLMELIKDHLRHPSAAGRHLL